MGGVIPPIPLESPPGGDVQDPWDPECFIRQVRQAVWNISSCASHDEDITEAGENVFVLRDLEIAVVGWLANDFRCGCKDARSADDIKAKLDEMLGYLAYWPRSVMYYDWDPERYGGGYTIPSKASGHRSTHTADE